MVCSDICMQVTSFVQITLPIVDFKPNRMHDGANRKRETDGAGASHDGDRLSYKKNAQHESVEETLVAADGQWYAALFQV